MKKLNVRKELIILLIISAVLFVFLSLFFKEVKSILYYFIGEYGYIALFIASILIETLPQPLGAELLIIAGFLFNLNIMLVTIIVSIGAIIASLINYFIGHLFYPQVCKDHKCDKYVDWYQKYGVFGLFIAAAGPLPFVPFCWISGAFGLSMKQFFYFGVLPRTARLFIIPWLLTFVNI